MIIYDQDVKGLIRIEPPRPAYYPWYRPITAEIEPFDPKIAQLDRLMFIPEFDRDVLNPDLRIHVLDVPWRWYCQDCYAAYGSKEDVFHTDWKTRRYLTNWGTTVCSQQEQQISDHGRQHSIMWAWVRSVK